MYDMLEAVMGMTR